MRSTTLREWPLLLQGHPIALKGVAHPVYILIRRRLVRVHERVSRETLRTPKQLSKSQKLRLTSSGLLPCRSCALGKAHKIPFPSMSSMSRCMWASSDLIGLATSTFFLIRTHLRVATSTVPDPQTSDESIVSRAALTSSTTVALTTQWAAPSRSPSAVSSSPSPTKSVADSISTTTLSKNLYQTLSLRLHTGTQG